MPLFQQSVIRKHIESFDAKHIEDRWIVFKGFFHSSERKQSRINKCENKRFQRSNENK